MLLLQTSACSDSLIHIDRITVHFDAVDSVQLCAWCYPAGENESMNKKKMNCLIQAAGNYSSLVINRLSDRQLKEYLMCNIQHRILVDPGAFLDFQT